ncbi:MAG: glycoside hydrolase family 172 protein [Mangrovibacterium sp.]
MKKIKFFLILLVAWFSFEGVAQQPVQLYKLKNLDSRAATAENPLAEKGKGGMTKEGLKGSPAIKDFKSGTTETLLNTKGPGMVRHIWCTVSQSSPVNVRNIILRMYWENNDIPSVEVPLADFFGMSHGANALITSQLVSIQPSLGYNCDIPMPFKDHARITVTNESETDYDWFFYQIDFTIGDKIKKDDGRFHASFNRENPTQYGRDYTIMETKGARGVFLGCVIGVRPLVSGWWGEGEMKFYIDGDTKFPTICGTGIEDYFGAAWGLSAHSAPYRGAPLVEAGFCSMYRFHVNDPVYFQNEIKINVQQMGTAFLDDARKKYGASLIFMRFDHPRRSTDKVYYLRSDDVSSVAYWYQYPLVKERKPIPNKEQRSKDLYVRSKDEEVKAPM